MSFSEFYPEQSWQYKALLFSIVLVPFLVPALPVLISCAVSIISLHRSRQRNLKMSRRDASDLRNDRMASASHTVLIVTGVYIFYNVPQWVYLVLWVWNPSMPWWGVLDHHDLLYSFVSVVCVVMNAATNPIVYIVRIAKVGTFVKSVLTCNPELRRSTEAIKRWRVKAVVNQRRAFVN